MRNSFLIIPLIALASCSSNQQTETKTADSSVTATADTMMIGTKICTFDSISKAEFEEVYKKNGCPEVFEGKNDDSTHVLIDSMQIVLHLQSGIDSVLTNNYEDESDNFINYSFIRSYNEINYWSFHVSMFEGGSFLIVNKKDGSKIWTWGEPLFSPNKNYFLCNSFDLESGFIPNGFQLYAVVNGKPVFQWEKQFNDWGPSRICWKNNDEIYIERSARGENGYSTRYSKVKIAK